MHLPDRLNIPDDALVLEIGGGGDPHPRASVLVDKYPGADGERQRGGAALVVGSRALIQADASRLPFRDDQFGYVIASHVIEHIPSPDVFAFVGELQRVAPRGYLEAPSVVFEILRDIPEHVWLVHLADGRVHLAARGHPQSWTRLTDPLFEDAGFREVVERLADVFFVGMEWEESLSVTTYETVDELVGVVPAGWATDAMVMGDDRIRAHELERDRLRWLAAASLPPFISQRLRAAMRRVREMGTPARVGAGGSPTIIGWRDVVVCPVCRGALIEEAPGRLCCASCRQSYEVSSGDVPCLLTD
jgi:hypothetical protein